MPPPHGTMLPTVLRMTDPFPVCSLATYHRLPSGPATMSCALPCPLLVGSGKIVMLPPGATRPSRLSCEPANQTVSSGPAAMPVSDSPVRVSADPGSENSTALPAGVMRPILPADPPSGALFGPFIAPSVNHRLPSGPAAMAVGTRSVPGSSKDLSACVFTAVEVGIVSRDAVLVAQPPSRTASTTSTGHARTCSEDATIGRQFADITGVPLAATEPGDEAVRVGACRALSRAAQTAFSSQAIGRTCAECSSLGFGLAGRIPIAYTRRTRLRNRR
jgi:hypothetical protein